MNVTDQDDPILRRLSRLPMPAPDAARARRVVERGHAVAARRRSRALARHRFARRVVEPALVGGFSLAYLVALVHDLLRWHGVL
jgi:hypothetical protein